MPELPATRIPPGATAEAAKAWAENPLARAWKLARLTPEGAEEWVAILVGSGTARDLKRAIEEGVDPVPIIIDRGELENGWVKLVAPSWLRTKWSILFPILRDPVRVRELVRKHDPAKGQLLDSPAGGAWLNWTLWRATTFLGWYADVKISVVDRHGSRRVVPVAQAVKPPPGDCVLRLCAIPMMGST